MVLFIKNFNTCVTVSFAVDQAYDAYQRFGFTNCRLFRNPDSLMYATPISNLENGFCFLILKGKDFQKTSKFMVK